MLFINLTLIYFSYVTYIYNFISFKFLSQIILIRYFSKSLQFYLYNFQVSNFIQSC